MRYVAGALRLSSYTCVFFAGIVVGLPGKDLWWSNGFMFAGILLGSAASVTADCVRADKATGRREQNDRG